MSRQPISSVLALALVAGTAVAQQPPPVHVVRIDHGPYCDGSDPSCVERSRTELALRASPSTFDIIAVWHERIVRDAGHDFVRVYYNASTNGKEFQTVFLTGLPDSRPVPQPPGSCWNQLAGTDPTVAFTQDGTGWIGYLGPGETGLLDRLWMTKKLPGAYSAYVAWPEVYASGQTVDKDVIAAGPARDPSGGEIVSGFFVAQATSPPVLDFRPETFPLMTQYSNFCGSGPQHPAYRDMFDPEEIVYEKIYRAPNAALILRGPGTQYHGRQVVGQYFRQSASAPPQPGAAYSNDGGQNWTLSSDPKKARKANTSGDTENILWNQSYATLYQPVIFWHFPLLAADPNDPSKVYMVFTGRSENDANSNNIDIFIAQSTDGGIDFSGVTGLGEGKNVIRLTDHDLGDDVWGGAVGAVQFFPSIVVDQWGVLHIQYYVGRWSTTGGSGDSPHWEYKVKLAHIPNFDVTQRPAVSTVDLTSYVFNLNDPSIDTRGGIPFIGDYMNSTDVRGCEVISGYIAPPEEGGPLGVFVAFTLIPNSDCVIDPNCYVNCDGSSVAPILNANDFLCFMGRYAAGESYANCDGSTVEPVLNANDFQCFLNKWTAGCT